MGLAIQPLTETFGAEIRGVDLSRPLHDDTFAKIVDAFHRYSMLLWRHQEISASQHIAFSRRFGELEIHVLNQYLLPNHPEILVISNVIEDGKPKGLYDGGIIEWHSDLAWSPWPSLGSTLYAVEVPPIGGDTLFADMYAAYDALPSATQQYLTGLKAVFSLDHLTEMQRKIVKGKPPLDEEQKRQAPDVVHPLIRRHPVTGRKSLFIGDMVIKNVVGMAQEEGQELINELCRHATQPAFIYCQQWQKNDLLLWDNRCTIHTATSCDSEYRRVLYRTSIKGDTPF